MWNLKIQVNKTDPPTELTSYVGGLIPKDKTMVKPPADKHKDHIKKFI